jgi:nitrate reductase / nitrite oxidoreductase, alpha subunit
MKIRDARSWIKEQSGPALHTWEEIYRNRWQHDKIVRSTHGVNCTGSCSWQVYVKDGIVSWEMQALDYPRISPDLPPHEPRGCQRGISYSWYLYSPLRVKYPYMRGTLLDAWKQARVEHSDPVEAWTSIVENGKTRAAWQKARGKGGFRRVTWDEAAELIAAANIYTIKKYGPDRIAGFSPIPAMSMISYASGARMLQLMGGVALSFYDWYCDLPNASPQTWGEQTDVPEAADWFNAKMIAVVGSNLSMTRTPDCHFAVEARHNGTRLWAFSPDFAEVAKYADEWVPISAGQDAAFWLAVNHVLLQEFHHQRQVPFFLDYARSYTDAPYLVELTRHGDSWRAGKLLRANRIADYRAAENGDWKFLVWDAASDKPKMPMGSVGHRWGSEKSKWNLIPKDAMDGSPIEPALTFLGSEDETVPLESENFEAGKAFSRDVPIKKLHTVDGGEVVVATVYDLLFAQYGVSRGLKNGYPSDYKDPEQPYTPAWAEKHCGIPAERIVRFAREWGETAASTRGKCTAIIGAGVNHWYHGDLIYRAVIGALLFCGCVGTNGGGLAHYVGQEKLAPMESWSAIAFGRDWYPAPRLQNAPSWHYVNSDQWRYEREFAAYQPLPNGNGGTPLGKLHTMDLEVQAVRNGWLPFYPQFNRNPLEVAADARQAGAKTADDITKYIVQQLRERKLKFAVEDPDAPENWPRVWFIWRGNALMASAKGHEYFLKHYLGTHTNAIAPEVAEGSVHEVQWHEHAPQGKLDLVVDLNFRMDTSALYSDIVLPAATWYEKSDLNSTDMHTFIHPLSAAVAPAWESKSDWHAYQLIAKKIAELAAIHFPEPVTDIVAAPLAHDSPAEIAQPEIRDWSKGECDPVPGKTMPGFRLIERDYKNLYNQFISLGPLIPANGLGAHGTSYNVEDEYEHVLQNGPAVEWNGKRYPSLAGEEDACNAILRLATVTNGELAYRSYQRMEEKTGVPLAQLAEKNRGVRISFKDLQARPHRLLNSPIWSGLIAEGRAYSPFTYNLECNVPWRTLTGRQHFYLDHPLYLQFGENLPCYKPRPLDLERTDIRALNGKSALPNGALNGNQGKLLNFMTAHGKWQIHSTYSDNHRMTTLSRGVEPLWLNDADAAEIAIADNDWVEVHNDNGVVVTRAVVSARIPRGVCIQYHSPERTLSVPKSPLRNHRRAGGHNSLTRIRLKPTLMAGGYGQFTYHFNYWGPTGTNRDTHVLVRKLPELVW